MDITLKDAEVLIKSLVDTIRTLEADNIYLKYEVKKLQRLLEDKEDADG